MTLGYKGFLDMSGLGRGFLDMSPKAQATKEKIDKLDSMLKLNSCASKDTSEKTTHRMGENICKSYIC